MIDPVVPRFTALLKEEAIPVHVKDASTGVIQKPKHPKVRTLLSFSKYVYYNIGGKKTQQQWTEDFIYQRLRFCCLYCVMFPEWRCWNEGCVVLSPCVRRGSWCWAVEGRGAHYIYQLGQLRNNKDKQVRFYLEHIELTFRWKYVYFVRYGNSIKFYYWL